MGDEEKWWQSISGIHKTNKCTTIDTMTQENSQIKEWHIVLKPEKCTTLLN